MKMPPWPEPLGFKPQDFGLERIKLLLDRLKNPQEKLSPVIHIAGTNGKGSTLAYIRAIYQAAGLRVHAYTSPHLVEFNERISLNGCSIDDTYLLDIAARCETLSNDIKITFFEGTTAMAFLAFAEIPADVVLLETGCGGRLDATNVISSPACHIITPISMDHMQFLGNDLKTIAGEKAAIMRVNTPCIIGPQETNSLQVILAHAKNMGAEAIAFGQDWYAAPNAQGFMLSFEGNEWQYPSPNLVGTHQWMNAAMAVMAVERNKHILPITKQQIEAGLMNADWLGRMQLLSEGRLVDLLQGRGEIWLDGGHNEAAAKVIAQQVKTWRQEKRDAPVIAVLGMLKRKEVARFLSQITNVFDEIYAIPITGEEEGMHPDTIAHIAESFGIKIKVSSSINTALGEVTATHVFPRVICCGSLYLVGNLLEQNNQIDKLCA